MHHPIIKLTISGFHFFLLIKQLFASFVLKFLVISAKTFFNLKFLFNQKLCISNKCSEFHTKSYAFQTNAVGSIQKDCQNYFPPSFIQSHSMILFKVYEAICIFQIVINIKKDFVLSFFYSNHHQLLHLYKKPFGNKLNCL